MRVASTAKRLLKDDIFSWFYSKANLRRKEDKRKAYRL